MDPLATLGCYDDAEIRLDLAALDIAAADRVRPDLSGPLLLLDSLAARLPGAVRGSAAQAGALGRLLAREEGFTGDCDDYDHPRNADFISVLERRRGLPVALAILYVAIARRHGWAANLRGVPGHVFVAIGPEAEQVMLDPFHDGRMLENAVPGTRPMDNRETLVRLVMNQASRALKAGDEPRALTLYRRLTLVAPGMPALWWERARLEQKAGDKDAARRSLAAMRETTHDPDTVGRIRAAFEALAR
ncbi:transglutaminase-like domain-containing protein [Sandaracinobacter sp. RS1-74]|uniref:transglutaminase family protein n=1 Tax=Sandaracinobacteroides sayramensis TaxID=2913411 RepID=UPI001ED9F72B|nr:transglutaminase-like domain-containing protein [Sandaracinobacteroides sayramensis]MCG2841847.1 transglutaminase-like domain-containing protein [Sandaracinobacteroides sayramensis]